MYAYICLFTHEARSQRSPPRGRCLSEADPRGLGGGRRKASDRYSAGAALRQAMECPRVDSQTAFDLTSATGASGDEAAIVYRLLHLLYRPSFFHAFGY